MKKKIKIFSVHPPVPGATDLSRKLRSRILENRRRLFSERPDVVEWIDAENAKRDLHDDLVSAFGKSDGIDPDFNFAGITDSIVKRQSRAPVEVSDHPDYPIALHHDEAERIDRWVTKRIAKARQPEKLHDKVGKDERQTLVSSCRMTEAVYLSEHEVDEIFADLHAMFPWLAMLNEKAWKQARLRSAQGRPAGIGPLILLGPPGLGKSTWAREVARQMGVPGIAVDAGQTGGMMEIQGVSKGWGNTDRGRLVASIVEDRIANPVVIVDEIDAGSSVVEGRQSVHPGLFKAMMGLIEPSTSREWTCPSYQIKFDMRNVSWVATSNDISRVEQALIDRMTVIDLPELTREQIIAFARDQAAVRLGYDAAHLVVDHIERLLWSGRRLSLRHVDRAIRRAEEALERPVLN